MVLSFGFYVKNTVFIKTKKFFDIDTTLKKYFIFKYPHLCKYLIPSVLLKYEFVKSLWCFFYVE